MSAMRVAADLAAVLDRDDPLALVARELLEMTMPDVNRIGTPLQDAAVTANVDPNAILPPTNAGATGAAGDPHGPNVVAIGIDDPRRLAAVKAAREAQSGPYAGEAARRVAAYRKLHGANAVIPAEVSN